MLITADDMNWDAVGAFGCPIAGTTPNIDRLAAEGLRFQHGHVTIAVCQPSRSALMTDLFTHRVLEEFYDFANDPNALKNLIDDPSYADEIQELRNALEEWMVETDDPALNAFRGRASRQELDDLMDHLADAIGQRADE